MRIVRQGICLWAVVLLSLASVAHAQTAVTPEDEFKQKIRVSQDIQPLGDKPFGENINLYNGSVSFTQTDVDAPGDGPDLLLTRTYSPADLPATQYYVGIEASALTDWTLNVPRIETLSARDLTLSGQWFFLDNTQRCTNFHAAPDITVQQTPSSTPTEYEPGDWWHGYQMITADGTSQDLLKRDAANTLSPTMSGKTFPIVTKQQWMISCLAQTSNGQPGEAFLAVAPDGTRYWFDWLAYKQAPSIIQKAGAALQRRVAMMLASHIEDRFGNSLTYTYDALGNPTRIEASDGRVLTLAYQTWTTGGSITGSRLTSATLQTTSGTPRTWAYSYVVPNETPVLSQVQLPDGTSWGFDFPVMTTYASELFDYVSGCQTIVKRVGDSRDFVVRHPSGLQGTFTLTNLVRGRSDVPGTCSKANPNHWKTLSPDAYSVRAVTQKVLSGAGLANRTWNFAYSPANESAEEDCTSGCASTVWTDVTDPEGHATRHTFSNRFDASESLLLRTDYYAGAIGSTLLRSEANSYAAPNAGAWPSVYGSTQQMYLNAAQTEQLSPLNQRVITQDGDAYTWQAETFNAYAQITKTKRFNLIAGGCVIGGLVKPCAKEDSTSYLNDTNLWVLGLPLTVTNVATGEVESSNTYDSSNDTLLTRSHFGQTLMHYTFNSAGQLASFTDGNTNTTTLGNYKRGIPQAIDYPDGTSQSLAVDDFGQITSITDQAGHTTSYTYDPVGRVTQISYPSGDERAWYPSLFTYDYVTAAERGIGAGHWRRVVSKGSARAVTYFDAMLRPVLSDSYIDGVAGSNTSTLTNYDSKGQKLFSAYPSATALTFTTAPGTAGIKGSTSSYDALGRLVQTQQDSEVGVLTASTAYLSGARQQVTDPKGNITTTSYQVFDQPSYDAVIKVQAPAGITQTIARDPYGNPTEIHQYGSFNGLGGDVTKTLIYDSYHRLCRTTEPESGSEVMGYDGANNLAWSVSGATLSNDGSCHAELAQSAGVTTRRYDAMNRIEQIQPPSGTPNTRYDYDAAGRMTCAVTGGTCSPLSGASIWRGTYNFRGMLTGESLQLSGQSAWGMGYAHDAYGSVSVIHYPDGENVSYAPDALGRATQVGAYATGLAYFADGAVKYFSYGNGAAYLADQNLRQLVSEFSYTKSSVTQLSEELSYDANGNITKVNDRTGDETDGPRSKTFGYDALNRLTSAQAAGLWGTESYTYDPLNNLRSRVSGGQTLTYNYNPLNQLASISGGAGSTFAYDNRGNVITKNGVSLAFDQKNQLTQIDGYGSYAYDAAGRRVMKTPPAGGAPTYYFYSQAGQLMYQVEPGKARTTNFIYLGRKLVADNETLLLVAPGAVSFDPAPNNGSYTVSWGAVPAATSYLLQESANGGAWTTVYSGSAANKALSGREGGSYVYRVEGCVGTTCGGWTTSATLGVRPALPTVSVPSGTINGSYTVSWTAPASATGYDVQERLNGGSWTTIASNTAATSISRPGTTSGSYTYQVSAKNTSGSRGWAASSAVTVDTTYGVVPDVPASLTVPATSATGSVTISWSAASLATTYVLQQSGNGGTTWSAAYNGSGTSTAIAGLVDGSYVYQVQACNTYGCSAWQAGSATLVVTHPPVSAPSLTAPASSASGSYTVSWSGVPGPVSYTLQEQVNGGSWATIQNNGTTSKAISGKGNGSYGYRVQACNVSGCGPWSATDTTTVLLPPAAPSSITVPATSSGSIAVSWAASSTATSYTLQQRLGSGSWGSVYTGAATGSTRTVTASGSYTYQVQACNASGCSAYKASSAVTVTIPPATAPSLSVPASSSTGSYTVGWSGVGGATSYTLQEQVSGGSWATIQSSSATSKALSGKGNGTYGYRVQACNAGGCGAWSGTGSIAVALVPAVPSGAVVVDYFPNSSTEGNKAQWNAVSGATRYEAIRNDTGASVYSGTATSFVIGTAKIPALPPYYAFSVRACNAAGCSAWAVGH